MACSAAPSTTASPVSLMLASFFSSAPDMTDSVMAGVKSGSGTTLYMYQMRWRVEHGKRCSIRSEESGGLDSDGYKLIIAADTPKETCNTNTYDQGPT